MNARPIPNPYLRVSDAERQEVAEILKQHAAEGRLDTAEFEARLDRTLHAKTRADLAAPLDDLPDLRPPGSDPRPGPYGQGPGRYEPGPYGYRPRPYSQRPASRPLFSTLVTLGLVLVAFFATLSVISSVARPDFAWLIVLVVAVALWRRGHACRRWRA